MKKQLSIKKPNIKLFKKTRKVIPCVFAADDNYAPFLVVCFNSLKAHMNPKYDYKCYVLQTNISDKYKQMCYDMMCDNLSIEFIDVTKKLDAISDKLYLRDYYTNTTYYRFFIPGLFPQYKKALYLDCDMVFLDDVAKLYNTNLMNNLLGAVTEDVMVCEDVFGTYAEKAIGIERHRFFNAGMILMNLQQFRRLNIEDKFVNLLTQFKFTVTQDEDILNALCKDKVHYFHRGWNKSPIKEDDFDDTMLKIVHYKMSMKPWKYDGVLYGDYFWQYAKNTPLFDMLVDMKNKNNTVENKEKDATSLARLKSIAVVDSADPNNYYNTLIRKKEKLNRDIDPMLEIFNFASEIIDNMQAVTQNA